MVGIRISLTTLLIWVAIGTTARLQTEHPVTKRIIFPESGIRVSLPGQDDCYITVDLWDNASYFTRNPDQDAAFAMSRFGPIWNGTSAPAPQGSENAIILQTAKAVLAAMIEGSMDMRNKVRRACKLIRGVSDKPAERQAPVQLAIRLVNNDPNVLIGSTARNSNLVRIDIGDVNQLVKNATVPSSAGASVEAVANAIATVTTSVLIATFAHEIDHLSETGDGLHSDPGKGAPEGDEVGAAVRDEDVVLFQMGYKSIREKYQVIHDGKIVIQYVSNGVPVNLDPTPLLPPGAKIGDAEHQFTDADVQRLNEVDDRCCDPPVRAGNVAAKEPFLPRLFGETAMATIDFDPADVDSSRLSDFTRESLTAIGRALGFVPIEEHFRSTSRVENARASADGQGMGATSLSYLDDKKDHNVVVAENRVPPRQFSPVLTFGVPRRLAWPGKGSHLAATFNSRAAPPFSERSQPSRRARPVTAVFTSLGQSSGEAFRMDLVSADSEPLSILAAGFVLEPIADVRPQDIERDLARLKGRRASATITAYCLEFDKPPPAANMIYRLVPAARSAKFSRLGPIMASSKMLLEQNLLNPDSDPKEYFHSIRQWSLWVEEKGWKTEQAFGEAFLAFARKNYAAAKRPWTAQVESSIKRIIPGRWRDIEAVLSERDVLMMLR